MKAKLFFLGISLLFLIPSYAQKKGDNVLSGSFVFSTIYFESDNASFNSADFRLFLGYGRMISDETTIGVRGLMELYDNSDNNYKLRPYVRYQNDIAGKLQYYVDSELQVNLWSDRPGFYSLTQLGLSYFIKENIALDMDLVYLGFAYYNDPDLQTPNFNLTLNYLNFSPSIAVNYYF